MITLLEKAKSLPQRTNFQITKEVIELALAWQKDEITITALEKVLKVKEHNKIYAILARALKASYQGLKLSRVPEKNEENKKEKIIKANSETFGSEIAPSKY